MTPEENKITEENITETENVLSDTVKDLFKPENIIGPFKSVEELMQNTWDSED